MLRKLINSAITLLFAGILVLCAATCLPGLTETGVLPSAAKVPVNSVRTSNPHVSLCFDITSGHDDLQAILDILAAHDVKASFFLTGSWVENYPEDVKKIFDAGHDLGNHSQNHKYMTKLSSTEVKDELLTVHEKVKELTGYEMFLFRPPYGNYDNDLLSTVEEIGYIPINGNIDALDWKDYETEEIIQGVLNNPNLGNGSIILCHSGTRYTKDALEGLLTGIMEKGYQFIPVSSMVLKENYQIDKNGCQIQEKK